MRALRDTWLIFRRSMILTLRQPVWIIMGMFQPVLYLLFLGPLLDASVRAAGAFPARSTGSSRLLIQTALRRIRGFGLIAELLWRPGRIRVTPMSGWRCCSGGRFGTW
jgi:ABC-2 type transport system permease protein